MNDSRFAVKVGIFVAVGLALAALLILNFSKGPMWFQPTYKLEINMPTVAGLKPAADVMMAGVPIGKVVSTTLSQDGRSVNIIVQVLSKYEIRKDAVFHIDALGFLGDQYIEVTPAELKAPGKGEAPLLTNGEVITGEAPFNMQTAVRSISSLVDQGQKTMKDLDQSISSVNSTILEGHTLTNFVATMNNFQTVTGDAVNMAKQLRGMLDSDLPPVHNALTNFSTLSEKLNIIADKLDQTVTTNTGEVSDAVKSMRVAAADLRQITDGLQAGQGLAGGLLKDEGMKTNFYTLVTNFSTAAEQIGRFGKRLNENSLWKLLFSKPKEQSTNAAAH